MKKLFTLTLSLMMVLGLVACSSTTTTTEPSGTAAAGSASYTAGTYTGTGSGMWGDIKADVTFTDSKIESINVTESNETAYMSLEAYKIVTDDILNTQSLGVDTVTGATFSSRGLINAVADAATQAGADAEALKSVAVTKEGGSTTEDYDVVVVGAGGAGLTAALAAVQEGATVAVVEKAGYVGGNTLVAGKVWNAADPDVQKTENIDASSIATLQEILTINPADYGDYAEDFTTLQGQIKEYLDSGETYLFDSVELHEYNWCVGGTRTGLDGTEIVPDYALVHTIASNSLSTMQWMSDEGFFDMPKATFTVLGALWPRTHWTNENATAPEDGYWLGALKAKCEELGVKFYMQTAADALLTADDGAVNGVHAVIKATNGELTLNAKNVVLASGGYGANAALCAEYDNYWGTNLSASTKTDNVGTAQGDAISMVEPVKANLIGMGFVQLMPSCSPRLGTMTNGIWGDASTQVWVNSDGARFVNEYAERDVLSSTSLEQKDGLFWIIVDSDDLGNYTEDQLAKLESDGDICRGETLEDLATACGFDSATFTAEMDKYNGYVDSGVDADFGKANFVPTDTDNAVGKIDKGPFVASVRHVAIHHTMGGIEINTDAQVIDTDGNVIPGLFAAGEVTGGIHAGNRCGGNATADIEVMGKIAGTNAAK